MAKPDGGLREEVTKQKIERDILRILSRAADIHYAAFRGKINTDEADLHIDALLEEASSKAQARCEKRVREERERIRQIIKTAELPVGTTGGSIQEACRRTILKEIEDGK